VDELTAEMRGVKRHLSACDADYDVSPDPTAQQTKRQKLLELDGVQVTHVILLAVCDCPDVALLQPLTVF